ncbi:hypothetical protein ABS772_06170 [Methylorubrum podarium]|uniref:Uncharacterized protein n=1 Tax=Methylorubrum podarium TaxID=200476 RepID=A0ABV1QJC9_9HYPH
MISDNELISRAMDAWFQSGRAGLPSEASSVYEVDGQRYVELVNPSGTLAVYSVDGAGHLEQLGQWPKRPTTSPAHGSFTVDGGVRFIDEEEDRRPSRI